MAASEQLRRRLGSRTNEFACVGGSSFAERAKPGQVLEEVVPECCGRRVEWRGHRADREHERPPMDWFNRTQKRETLQQNEYNRSVPKGARVERGNVDAWNRGDCHLVHHEIWRNLHECCYYPTYSNQRFKIRNTDDSHVWLRKFFFHLIVIGDEPLPFLRERADRIAFPHAVVVGKER